GVWLWARLDATAPAAVRDLEARHVRRTVWDQRSAPGAGRPRVRVRAQTLDCTALRVTPHDPGVRAGEQRGQNWRGDNVHVPATAEPDAPRFIPEVTTAPAPRGATAALPPSRARREARAPLPAAQDVDAGDVCGPQRAQRQAAGRARGGPPCRTPPRTGSRAPPARSTGRRSRPAAPRDTARSHGARAPRGTAAGPSPARSSSPPAAARPVPGVPRARAGRAGSAGVAATRART